MMLKLKRAVLCWLGLHYDVEYTYDVWGMWGRCRDCYKPTGDGSGSEPKCGEA